jgi:two-component system cell cycle response regulator DivK
MSEERRTILVVEDDRLSRKLFEDVLLAHGYSVLMTADALVALETAKKCRPDLILLDIRLPNVDGRRFLTMLKGDSTLRDIPVLAVSAYLVAQDRKILMDLGAANLLIKPVPIDQLVYAVAAIVA